MENTFLRNHRNSFLPNIKQKWGMSNSFGPNATECLSQPKPNLIITEGLTSLRAIHAITKWKTWQNVSIADKNKLPA